MGARTALDVQWFSRRTAKAFATIQAESLDREHLLWLSLSRHHITDTATKQERAQLHKREGNGRLYCGADGEGVVDR